MAEAPSGITSSHPVLPEKFARRSTGGWKPWMKKPGPCWTKMPSRRVRRCSLRVPPPAPILRPKQKFSKKRKYEVCMFLLHHKVNIEEAKLFRTDPYNPGTRVRIGMPRPHQLPYDTSKYRPPTYEEAEKYFKIPKATMTAWWEKRHEYLPASEFEFEKTMFDPPPTQPLAKDTPRPARFLQMNMFGVDPYNQTQTTPEFNQAVAQMERTLGMNQNTFGIAPAPIYHHHNLQYQPPTTANQVQTPNQSAPITIHDDDDDSANLERELEAQLQNDLANGEGDGTPEANDLDDVGSPIESEEEVDMDE